MLCDVIRAMGREKTLGKKFNKGCPNHSCLKEMALDNLPCTLVVHFNGASTKCYIVQLHSPKLDAAITGSRVDNHGAMDTFDATSVK